MLLISLPNMAIFSDVGSILGSLCPCSFRAEIASPAAEWAESFLLELAKYEVGPTPSSYLVLNNDIQLLLGVHTCRQKVAER